ncbi:hypothetical protein NK553_19930 [Pseudomonas sp. ZM23]|uniref:Uncharacterized protein n=1 Tax=Pseudomonas triclosanedens TaxID=2961893 RepID=A0ABY6ZQF9_9PSED|nr:hypothetical protein [Pseudomonas triclosanedens]MCP8466228.1 hypothetical protein [Pseudomonas triclosanedens]MCP8472463.1 hypothetical protein [Pseudomonas triclosanedens]MCP8477527.1 hypothetical protein [Pseudomonas triclosanedens]WAI47142.1 hypothetical protein OU419_15285 [Pseudomonas triclosanedens]
MKLHEFSKAKELFRSATELSIDAEIITDEIARNYIKKVFEKYKPGKTSGHFSISSSARRIPTDEYESSFSRNLKEEKAYVFFEQNQIDKNTVFIISDARELSKVIENSFGMEYFISNQETSYLIAVNWYSIEYTGEVNLN